MQPKTISVVVPTYNRVSLLPATLDAILAQTLPPHEIIVVDDGSQDTSRTVLQRYAPRVHTIAIQNAGDLVARNTGLRQASTDLVAFCDSDDLWTPRFLEMMASLWDVEPRTRAACCDFVVVRDDEWEQATKFSAAPPGFWDGLRQISADIGIFDQPMIDRLLSFQPIFPSTMVVDRQFFLQLGGWDETPSRIVGCDFATALRVGEHPPIGVVRRPLVGIRKHAGNISGDVQAMNLGDAQVLEHVLTTRPSLRAYTPLIQTSIVARRRHAFDTAFARRDFAGVKTIYALLPVPARSVPTRLKRLVAQCPGGLREIAATILLMAGTLRATH